MHPFDPGPRSAPICRTFVRFMPIRANLFAPNSLQSGRSEVFRRPYTAAAKSSGGLSPARVARTSVARSLRLRYQWRTTGGPDAAHRRSTHRSPGRLSCRQAGVAPHSDTARARWQSDGPDTGPPGPLFRGGQSRLARLLAP